MFILIVPFIFCIISLTSIGSQQINIGNNIPQYCPADYHFGDTNTSTSGNMENLTICQFCPQISCYIAYGEMINPPPNINAYNSFLKNKAQLPTTFLSCSPWSSMPPEIDIVQHLDCVITGTSESELNLFIYPQRLTKKSAVADCLHPQFLSWFPPDTSFITLDLGAKIKEYPQEIFTIHRDFMSRVKTVRFNTDKWFNFPNFQYPSPMTDNFIPAADINIYLDKAPNHNNFPDTDVECTKTKLPLCVFPRNFGELGFKAVNISIPIEEIITASKCNMRLITDKLEKSHVGMAFDPDGHVPAHIVILMAICLVMFSLFLIFASILIYYIKRFAKFKFRKEKPAEITSDKNPLIK